MRRRIGDSYRHAGEYARALKVFRDCYDNGVIIRTTGDTLAFSPPLIIDEQQVETVVETVRRALPRAAANAAALIHKWRRSDYPKAANL